MRKICQEQKIFQTKAGIVYKYRQSFLKPKIISNHEKVELITYKNCGNGGMADTLDLGSGFWGFESLFPYRISMMKGHNK